MTIFNYRLTYVTIEGNPWQCLCLAGILEFLSSKGIVYRRRGYFDGKRPVCVVTSNNLCVKNIESKQIQRIIETYENALSEM